MHSFFSPLAAANITKLYDVEKDNQGYIKNGFRHLRVVKKQSLLNPCAFYLLKDYYRNFEPAKLQTDLQDYELKLLKNAPKFLQPFSVKRGTSEIEKYDENAESESASYLCSLPTGIIEIILGFVEVSDIRILSLVCKFWKLEIDTNYRRFLEESLTVMNNRFFPDFRFNANQTRFSKFVLLLEKNANDVSNISKTKSQTLPIDYGEVELDVEERKFEFTDHIIFDSLENRGATIFILSLLDLLEGKYEQGSPIPELVTEHLQKKKFDPSEAYTLFMNYLINKASDITGWRSLDPRGLRFLTPEIRTRLSDLIEKKNIETIQFVGFDVLQRIFLTAPQNMVSISVELNDCVSLNEFSIKANQRGANTLEFTTLSISNCPIANLRIEPTVHCNFLEFKNYIALPISFSGRVEVMRLEGLMHDTSVTALVDAYKPVVLILHHCRLDTIRIPHVFELHELRMDTCEFVDIVARDSIPLQVSYKITNCTSQFRDPCYMWLLTKPSTKELHVDIEIKDLLADYPTELQWNGAPVKSTLYCPFTKHQLNEIVNSNPKKNIPLNQVLPQLQYIVYEDVVTNRPPWDPISYKWRPVVFEGVLFRQKLIPAAKMITIQTGEGNKEVAEFTLTYAGKPGIEEARRNSYARILVAMYHHITQNGFQTYLDLDKYGPNNMMSYFTEAGDAILPGEPLTINKGGKNHRPPVVVSLVTRFPVWLKNANPERYWNANTKSVVIAALMDIVGTIISHKILGITYKIFKVFPFAMPLLEIQYPSFSSYSSLTFENFFKFVTTDSFNEDPGFIFQSLLNQLITMTRKLWAYGMEFKSLSLLTVIANQWSQFPNGAYFAILEPMRFISLLENEPSTPYKVSDFAGEQMVKERAILLQQDIEMWFEDENSSRMAKKLKNLLLLFFAWAPNTFSWYDVDAGRWFNERALQKKLTRKKQK